MQQELFDLLIAGGGFIPFVMPIRSFVEAAQGTSCKVFGCFEALRPTLDEDVMQALAARYWEAGVDGLYFFNDYSMSGEWKRDFLARLADPARLARANKQYKVDNGIVGPNSQLDFSFANAIPRVQLPASIAATPGGRGFMLQIDIADDIAAAAAEGALGPCPLGLGFEELPDDCVLCIVINGDEIPWSSAAPVQPWFRLRYDPDWNQYPSSLTPQPVQGEHIEFEISAPRLRQGVNQVEIRLEAGPSLLLNARLWIRYTR